LSGGDDNKSASKYEASEKVVIPSVELKRSPLFINETYIQLLNVMIRLNPENLRK